MPHATIHETSRRKVSAECMSEPTKKEPARLLWVVTSAENDSGGISAARTTYTPDGIYRGSDSMALSRDEARALIECLRRLL